MLYGGQKAFENFFKRHRFRRSRRLRNSFRASFIGRPRSSPRTTPPNQESSRGLNDGQATNRNEGGGGKAKKSRQLEIIRVEDEVTEETLREFDAPLEKDQSLPNVQAPLNNRKVYEQFSKYPVSKYKFSKLRPKTADTYKINKNTNNNNNTNNKDKSISNNKNENTNNSNNIENTSYNPDYSSFSNLRIVDPEKESIDSKMADLLKKEVTALRKEVNKQREDIYILREREKQLKDRLSDQARKQIEKGSTKFEDLSLGENRPSQLIKRYGNLYSEARVEALDALDELAEIRECEDLKVKLLLSIIVLSFRSAQKTLFGIKGRLRDILHLPRGTIESKLSLSPAAKDLEEEVGVYLRKAVNRFDLKKNVSEVSEKIWSTLFDYPGLKDCKALRRYINECVWMAWALIVQNPPLVIEYEVGPFEHNRHSRFHTSDPDSDFIKLYMWPALTEGEHGVCVSKGIVLT